MPDELRRMRHFYKTFPIRATLWHEFQHGINSANLIMRVIFVYSKLYSYFPVNCCDSVATICLPYLTFVTSKI